MRSEAERHRKARQKVRKAELAAALTDGKTLRVCILFKAYICTPNEEGALEGIVVDVEVIDYITTFDIFRERRRA